MPVGIQRLNAKKSQPNDHIVFIKPLKGPDEAIATEFLERIAAQCVPIMKKNAISVMTLEEYECNPEFVGRNFNAGEVIQLVLRSRSGRWLPFNYVQMVMMHELAHCKQMNHSRAFWAVRNAYADEMRVLWSHGYTGEGIWGRGARLSTGEFERNVVAAGEALPEHLCGGTYRSRGRKRRAKKPVLSYQEQRERRILKKFGKNGMALGEDEDDRARLEGKRVAAKPRIAGSKRSRELRAAAALARLKTTKAEAAKEEEKKRRKVEKENGPVVDDDETASEPDPDDDETASDPSDYEEDGNSEAGAIDINGKVLRDTKGQGLVKVCEDEDPNDQDARRELLELQSSIQDTEPAVETKSRSDDVQEAISAHRDGGSKWDRPVKAEEKEATEPRRDKEPGRTASEATVTKEPPLSLSSPTAPTGSATMGNDVSSRCAICSFDNGEFAVTCGMCSHVLDPASVPNSWRCRSAACAGCSYVNSGDAGICGVCGERRRE